MGVFPREWGGGGAKKLGMSFETRGIQTFWWVIPGYLLRYPGGDRKVLEKKLVFNSCPSKDLTLTVQFSSPILEARPKDKRQGGKKDSLHFEGVGSRLSPSETCFVWT